MVPIREIRAVFDERTIRVYQAYSAEIAVPAIQSQKFVPPFKKSRMTWIKPSFTWMMYRSGWASKPGQEYILGIDILRSGFECALSHSCLTHFDARFHESQESWEAEMKAASVRIQWDPERTFHLQPLPYRAIQIGLGPESVSAFVEEWITRIEDLTPLAKRVDGLIKNGDSRGAQNLLPLEVKYPLPDAISRLIGYLE